MEPCGDRRVCDAALVLRDGRRRIDDRAGGVHVGVCRGNAGKAPRGCPRRDIARPRCDFPRRSAVAAARPCLRALSHGGARDALGHASRVGGGADPAHGGDRLGLARSAAARASPACGAARQLGAAARSRGAPEARDAHMARARRHDDLLLVAWRRQLAARDRRGCLAHRRGVGATHSAGAGCRRDNRRVRGGASESGTSARSWRRRGS